MRRIIVILITLSFFACDFNNKTVDTASISKEVKVDVSKLEEEVSKLDTDEVMEQLTGSEKVKFSKRLREINKSLYKTRKIMSDGITKDEREDLKLEVRKTQQMWIYLVSNYPI